MNKPLTLMFALMCIASLMLGVSFGYFYANTESPRITYASPQVPSEIRASMDYPQSQFFDQKGKPAANWKLYFFKAGTSTPQATYTNCLRDTFNPNPLALDSAGRASVVFEKNKNYKLILARQGGFIVPAGVVWSIDNMPSGDNCER